MPVSGCGRDIHLRSVGVGQRSRISQAVSPGILVCRLEVRDQPRRALSRNSRISGLSAVGAETAAYHQTLPSSPPPPSADAVEAIVMLCMCSVPSANVARWRTWIRNTTYKLKARGSHTLNDYLLSRYIVFSPQYTAPLSLHYQPPRFLLSLFCVTSINPFIPPRWDNYFLVFSSPFLCLRVRTW